MLSFLWILRSWLLDCTAHGIPKVVSSANFHRKIFWLIAVVACTACFVYQISIMFQDVFNYPITVSVQITYPEKLTMPTVTICNSNKLKESLVREYDQKVETQLHKMIIYEGFTSIGLADIEQTLFTEIHGDQTQKEETSARGSGNSDDDPSDYDSPGGDASSNAEDRISYLKVSTTESLDDGVELDGFEDDCNEDRPYEPTWTDIYSFQERTDKVWMTCSNKECIPQNFICDEYDDCGGEATSEDEETTLCGSCERNKFECDDGTCIPPILRCDGKFDCPDASDELEQFCDPQLTENDFVCCTWNKKILKSQVCDKFDDCLRDRSDQLLESCVNKTNGLLFCYQPTDIIYHFSATQINKEQLNDGVEDCLFGVDENCGWKKHAKSWIHPYKTGEILEYFHFNELLRNNPAGSRWYTMATREEIRQLGHRFEDMVVLCVNNNKPCNESLIIEEILSQAHGMCYSFIQNSSVAASGPTYGLHVLFDLEISENMGLFSPTSGIKLYLTPPGLFGEAEDLYVDWDSEINLPPGFDHSISVHPKELSKLGKPYSDCEIYSSGRLAIYNSERECQRLCLLKKQFEECQCVDDIFFQDAPLCFLNQSESRSCVDHQRDHINPNTDCDCPNNCNSLNYDVMMSKLKWPTERSFAQFAISVSESLNSNISKAFLLEAVSKYQKKDGTMNASDSASLALLSIQSTFGRFTVYFSDLSISLIEERPVYNFVIVISNFGGLLGLYLGISVLTVLELFEFGFDFVEFMNLQGKHVRFWKKIKEPHKILEQNDAESAEFSVDQYRKIEKSALSTATQQINHGFEN